MRNVIKIIFQQDYKSFKKDSEYIFEGNLNIISGINGAGKSQLLESIKGPYTKVYMNEVLVQKNDIVYYSFKNNISLPSFGIYDYNSTRQYNNIITNIFNNYKNLYKSYTEHKTTNPQNYYEILGISKETSLDEYCMNNLNASISMKTNSSSNSTTSKNISKSSIAYIVKTVKEKHPDDFLEISNDEILESIPSNLFLKLQDETVEGIARVFTDAARIRTLKEAECGRKGKKFDNKKWLETAPWTEINNLFSKLNFNYRFSEDFDYEIPYLREEPKLFAYENGNINKRKERYINDLSDGEKAILNLVISTYDRKNDFTTKLLLLDEYDATLNPSLINDYYLTIQEYYLQKNIKILLSTHSPITISLAPEGAKYYEIFRQNEISPIIKEVNNEEYEELKVLKEYYNKIKNPTLRLKELEGENEKLKEIINIATKPIVITEGKTDGKHIKLSKEKLSFNISCNFCEYEDDMGDSALLNMLKDQLKISNPNKRIFIFDNDNEKILKEVVEEGKNYKDWGNNVYSFAIPNPGLRNNETKVSIEHYYEDSILKKEIKCEDGVIRRIYCGNDFNKKGINVSTNKRCDNRNVCGSDIIRVLSGSSNEKVYDLDKDDDSTNYALTKEDFFDKVVNSYTDEINFTPFEKILNIINEIVNVDKLD